MSAEYDSYIAKKTTLDGAESLVQRLLYSITAVVTPLTQGWKGIYVRVPGVGMPINMANLHQVDASGMASAEDLARAIHLYHTAKEEAKAAWNALPHAEKQQLKTPSW